MPLVPAGVDEVATARGKFCGFRSGEHSGTALLFSLWPAPDLRPHGWTLLGEEPFMLRSTGVAAPPVDELAPGEQEAFFQGRVKMVRALQERGEIPVSRMCVTCRYFNPNAHADSARPHHCAFIDAPFGDRHQRLECADHEAATREQAARAPQVHHADADERALPSIDRWKVCSMTQIFWQPSTAGVSGSAWRRM